MKKNSPGHYTVSDEERALFRHAVKNIKSPKKTKPIVPEFELKDHWPETVSAEDHLSFCKPDVPKPLFRKLKQGKIPFEANLDLHGKTVIQSKDLLTDFLADCYKNHYQCIKIIHGKSKYLEPVPPILKNYVNGWLKQHPAVLAFCSALLKHGGNGALYVLLQSR